MRDGIPFGKPFEGVGGADGYSALVRPMVLMGQANNGMRMCEELSFEMPIGAAGAMPVAEAPEQELMDSAGGGDADIAGGGGCGAVLEPTAVAAVPAGVAQVALPPQPPVAARRGSSISGGSSSSSDDEADCTH